MNNYNVAEQRIKIETKGTDASTGEEGVKGTEEGVKGTGSGDGGYQIMLCIISVLHIIVILFVLLAPFSNSNYFLFMHIIIVPFIMLHWYLNNNTCSLTIAEKAIRQHMNKGVNVEDDECYTYKFIAPIYDFNKNHEEYSRFIYILTSGLWLVSVYNLYTKFSNGSISSIYDLLS
jgi:hypothetical protein